MFEKERLERLIEDEKNTLEILLEKKEELDNLIINQNENIKFLETELKNLNKTSKDWLKTIPEIYNLEILDADGWDRMNYDFSFNEELISKSEFFNRLASSTISCNRDFFDYLTTL